MGKNVLVSAAFADVFGDQTGVELIVSVQSVKDIVI